ncbi:acylamino-acid-releasing enzyme-like isoform X1 [Penaeus chinensis]|uniref:acylamino-acid-releasing enzyme-like isoform X1 n=2 Tax=Penaeus chinensis TaxID=139456 RepID=UPI001FB7A5C1|nr:acylamino-acid-releasing enzyme-like isoform X1 [Penaeus chinensis]XP_047502843.1 acylamino-acid-releasing enzyme-like isoform X1 [Penaeus chinensis]
MQSFFSKGSRLVKTLHQQSRFYHCKMVDSVVAAYKELAKIPIVKGAKILSVEDNEVAVQVNWSVRNLAAMENSVSSSDYLVRGEKITAMPPVPVNKNILLSQRSSSGKRLACLVISEKEKDEQHVMVVEQDGSMSTIDLKTANKHGKIYADPEFSCLEWSPDDKMITYVAEKKRVKATSFLTPFEGEGEDGRGQEYVHLNEWGEQLEGKHKSVVCILNVDSGELLTHDLPDELCPGQLVWGPGGNGIIGVAFVSQPYRLGLVYCPNRESRLFYMDLEGKYTQISQGLSNIRSPRLSPDGSRIAFLRSTIGGPHAKSAQLCVMSWPSKEEKVAVDVVLREQKIEEGYTFKGIYGYSGLPARCWLSDSKRLLFSSYKFDNIVTYVVNVDSGAITELTHLGSMNVLDVYQDWMVADNSLISLPSRVLLGHVPGEGQEATIKNTFTEVTPRREIPGIPNHFRSYWSFVNEVPHPDSKYSDIPISVIYYGPTYLEEGAPKRPLICWPHGGPHSTVANMFYFEPSFFVKLGYSVVFPNYRGSLGFGEDGVNALPGHVGVVDVSDVHQAVTSCLERFKDVLDPSQVFLCGGSHGGFLVTHLAAKYPDFYKAVSARNPVTSISGLVNVTDIPDWSFVEAGFSFEPEKVADGSMLTKMLEVSPLCNIDNIKTPTLFLVGKNDARVPPSQSFHFHKMLLARGVDTKLLLYEDCHSLRKTNVEADSVINTALWFEKYRQK